MRTGLGWGSDPDFPVADWQYEVANDDTRQGYWEWVEQNREEARQDEGRCERCSCAVTKHPEDYTKPIRCPACEAL